MRRASGILALTALACLSSGCFQAAPQGHKGLFNADGRLALETENSPEASPVHLTQVGLAAEAEERFGLRAQVGFQQSSNGTGSDIDPVTGGAYERMTGNVLDRLLDFHYPIYWLDLNYTMELDDNFWLEVAAGSIFFGDGIRVPMPVGGDPSLYELKADNDFAVISLTGISRFGSGALGRIYAGLGANFYWTNVPNVEESINPSFLLRYDLYSSEDTSVSFDAKYWLMRYGDQEYLLLGFNAVKRF